MAIDIEKKKHTLITSWDDGLHSDLKLAFSLRNAGFKGTFYGTTGVSGGRQISDRDLEQIIAMGHEFGNHGWTHRTMDTLSRDEIIEELRIGREQVERFMKAAPIVAPPRGFLDAAAVDVLRSEGYLIRTAAIVGRARRELPLIDPTVQFFPHSRYRTGLHQLKHRTWAGWPVTRGWYSSENLFDRLAHILQNDERTHRPAHLGAQRGARAARAVGHAGARPRARHRAWLRGIDRRGVLLPGERVARESSRPPFEVRLGRSVG